MGKALAMLLAGVVGVVLVGWLAIKILAPLLFFLIVGAIVIGGGALLYAKAKRAVAPGTRNHNRIEAARETYRMRNR
ncbi:hypothetical protein ACIA5C_14995 [Actinoplanes sp. NPDC051343]|jgi:hypothetical protein|uniref:hypothetical protein n=1 Tax=Actinoplanes sp. NPDC051343 TaxID=3363906 RepID=UPI00379B5837